MSSDEYITDLGGNPDIVRRKVRERAVAIIKDAQAVAEETGMQIEQVLPFISKKFPNQAPVQGGGAQVMDSVPSPDGTQAPRSPAEAVGVDD